MSNTGSSMRSKIIFYEERNFQGRSYECTSDCSDMSSNLSRCQSCRVESGCFMVYERPNFMGNQIFLRRGEYADSMSMMGMRDCIRSCRMILKHRGQFRMKIFERENLSGQSHELMDDCDHVMECFHMNECMSCQVMEGPWLLFEQPQFRGKMIYVKPGEYRSFKEMGVSSTRFMSMRQITDSCN
ncbi:gamma-crystallin M3-like [Vanacampus margaritifer]